MRLCRQCSAPAAMVFGKSRAHCEKHLALNAARYRAHYAHGVKTGLCAICLKRKSVGGKRLCAVHLRYARDYQRAYHQRIDRRLVRVISRTLEMT